MPPKTCEGSSCGLPTVPPPSVMEALPKCGELDRFSVFVALLGDWAYRVVAFSDACRKVCSWAWTAFMADLSITDLANYSVL